MFCKHCGAPLDSDAKFCTSCGAGVDPAQSAQGTTPPPATRWANPAGPSPTKVMVFGIIGLALSGLGIPGIILSIIALKQANEFIRLNGGLFGQAKVGRILGKAGLIVSIVMTVFWVLYVILVILAFTRGMSFYAPSASHFYF